MQQPQDVQVLEGQQARQHQEFIVKGVREHLSKNGEEGRLKDFLTASKQFGQGELNASSFVDLLVDIFGERKGLVLVPTLAQLIRHDERRLTLLRTGANYKKTPPAANPAQEQEEDVFGPPTPTQIPIPARAQEESNGFEPLVPTTTVAEQETQVATTTSIEESTAAKTTSSSEQDEEGIKQEEKPLAQRVPLKMRVIADFINSEAWHLAVAEGDIVTATMVHDDGWTQVTGEDGGRGMVPTTYLEPAPEPPAPAVAQKDEVSPELFANLAIDEADVPVLSGQAAVERQRAATGVVRARLEAQGRGKDLEKFAAFTRSYAAGQLTAEQLRDNLDQLLGGHPQGANTCLDLAPLVKDTAKRKALLRVGRRATATSSAQSLPVSKNALDPDADDWIEQLRREKLQEQQHDKVPNFLGKEDSTAFDLAVNDFSSPLKTSSTAPVRTPQPMMPASQIKKNDGPVQINTDYMPTQYSAPPVPQSNMTTLPKKSIQNPFEDGAGAHLDEREILLSRSHGVGVYNPEMIERLQRLKEDEQLAARLQREEEEAVRRSQQRTVSSPAVSRQLPPNRPAAGTHLHAMPERRESEGDGFWGSIFGGSAPAPAPPVTSSTSGADVWNSIFGNQTNPTSRSQQELEDERLARQLQAEEEQRAGGPLTGAYSDPLRSTPSRTMTSSHAQYQRAPPVTTPSLTTRSSPPRSTARESDGDLSLFRCGACSETMHVKNAIPGAQFACPICGRLNTI
uniref:SH3 domain-containing protein n=2 Tax=Aureoumbra lagunensis TaxID=44058 RepID=A0A7S3JQ31_9STRA|mmetsp:Transcript_15411/g.20408  ORF Transcript_15411/g.20408 Transcript_15411/m.20408 type:complete len:739 (+) Transcript_15411:34-2250(+)